MQIILAEIGALIHDIGKLSREFIIQQSVECSDDKNFSKDCKFKHEQILKTPDFLGHSITNLFKDSQWQNLLKINTLSQLKQSPNNLGHFISGHTNLESGIGLLALITRCDQVDSGIDKGMLQDTAKQKVNSTFIASAFGYENIKLPINLQYNMDGFEPLRKELVSKIYPLLSGILKNKKISDKAREQIFKEIYKAYKKALGETRRSANDVTLWDHAFSVASLLKASLAQVILTNKWPSNLRDLKWRILRITFNGMRFIDQSLSIPDLKAKLDILNRSLNRIKWLLEFEYPIGNEIYRDENGSAFVVPDISNLLEMQNANGETLKDLILSAFEQNLFGELQLDLSPNWIAKPSRYAIELGKLLEKPLPNMSADPRKCEKWWNILTKGKEVCSICGIRPVGFPDKGKIPSIENMFPPWATQEKAEQRKMCRICLYRRGRSAEEWEKRGKNNTIWIDEVADENGRVALIVGKFNLRYWLEGSLLSTLLAQEFPKNTTFQNLVAQISTELRQNVSYKKSFFIKKLAPEAFKHGNTQDFYNAVVNERDIQGIAKNVAPNDFNKKAELLLLFVLRKNPSFARLRRIWKTTRKFWEDVAPLSRDKNTVDSQPSLSDSLAGKIVGQAGPRLEIRGIPKEIIQNGKLGEFHAYELVLLNNIKIAVLWDLANNRLITLENLVYTARNLGWDLPKRRENESREDYERRLSKEAADFVRNALHDKTVSLNIPPEYGTKSETITTFKAQVFEISDSFYTPLIPILAEPQVFMAIVPADKAFEVVKAIKTKYEREMGKVRNRLPLHIGVVYAYRKMPLRAILDAGRRMLEFNLNRFRDLISEWKVVDDVVKQKTSLPDDKKELAQNNSHFNEWYMLHLTNEKWDKSLKWYVPAVMGDGTTPDNWYPYVFVRSKNKPTSCSRCYEVEKNPWLADDRWVVHVEELKKDDRVYFTPATFDFEFLDTNARRFEIAYDDDGRRKGSLTKPYLLDEVEILEKIWKFMTQKQNGKPRLSTSQIIALREMIETKREEWFENPHDSLADENFKKFCHDLFANAQWQWGKPDKNELQWLADMAVRGYFTDAVYLFHHVMKEKIDDHTETR